MKIILEEKQVFVGRNSIDHPISGLIRRSLALEDEGTVTPKRRKQIT
jgi:transcriptional regulator of NAD metabolism